MKKLRTLFHTIWHDPVWSNMIANGIMAIILYLFYKFTSLAGKPKTPAEASNTGTMMPIHHIHPVQKGFLETTTGVFLIYAGYIILFGVVVLLFLRMIKGIRAKMRRNG